MAPIIEGQTIGNVAGSPLDTRIVGAEPAHVNPWTGAKVFLFLPSTTPLPRLRVARRGTGSVHAPSLLHAIPQRLRDSSYTNSRTLVDRRRRATTSLRDSQGSVCGPLWVS